MNRALIQLINITLYRLEKCREDESEGFLDFEIGDGVRTPKEILSHMVDVAQYTRSILGIHHESINHGKHEQLPEILSHLKAYLSENEIDMTTETRLINGPFSDMLTHVGQIAMLRRLAGKSIDHEDFSKAKL